MMLAGTLLFLAAAGATAAGAAPFRPADDAQVLETLPDRGDAAGRELRRLRERLSRDPENLGLALGLARRYFERSRAEADPRYLGYAQAALKPWWALADPPLEVLVLRATLRQARHDFTGALADLSRVLAKSPRNPQAWLTRAVILMVRGDAPGAAESCRRLRGPALRFVATTCLGAAEGLMGRAAQGTRRIEAALAESPDSGPRLHLWARTILAEIAARRGDPAAAERHFRAALSLGQRNAYLLGAYADFLLDQGRPSEVVALLRDETRADALLLRLALAEDRLGDPAAEAHVAALRARFEASRRRGDKLHLREAARFALELERDPARALRLAQENWRVQREPSDTRLLLEAARAASRPQAAAPVLDWLAATGLEDRAIAALAMELRKDPAS